jgi:hypothetical protein
VHLRPIAGRLGTASGAGGFYSTAQEGKDGIELCRVAGRASAEVAIARGFGDPLYTEVQLERGGALANAALVTGLRHDDRGNHDRQSDPKTGRHDIDSWVPPALDRVKELDAWRLAGETLVYKVSICLPI